MLRFICVNPISDIYVEPIKRRNTSLGCFHVADIFIQVYGESLALMVIQAFPGTLDCICILATTSTLIFDIMNSFTNPTTVDFWNDFFKMRKISQLKMLLLAYRIQEHCQTCIWSNSHHHHRSNLRTLRHRIHLLMFPQCHYYNVCLLQKNHYS